MMETTSDVTATHVVAALPGLAARLLHRVGGTAPEPLDAYVAVAGYQDGPVTQPWRRGLSLRYQGACRAAGGATGPGAGRRSER
jgi:hypothetical protein